MKSFFKLFVVVLLVGMATISVAPVMASTFDMGATTVFCGGGCNDCGGCGGDGHDDADDGQTSDK